MPGEKKNKNKINKNKYEKKTNSGQCSSTREQARKKFVGWGADGVPDSRCSNFTGYQEGKEKRWMR